MTPSLSTQSRSTGPVTAAGKETVSANRLSHGFSARKHFLLPGESRAAFEARSAELAQQWSPVSPLEHETLAKLAIAEWKLTRAENLETEFLANAIDPQAPNFGAAFEKAQNHLKALSRYLGSLRSDYNRCLALLIRLRADRRRDEKTTAIIDCKRAETEVHQRLSDELYLPPVEIPQYKTDSPAQPEPAAKAKPQWFRKLPKMRK